MSQQPDPPMQFGRVPTQVIFAGALADLTGAAAKVYVVLAAHADEHGRCRPGMRRLSTLAGLHIGTVSAAVKQLESASLITTSERRNGSGIAYAIAGSVRTGANALDDNRSRPHERLSEPTVRTGANGPEPDRSDFDGKAFGFEGQSVRAHANETEEQIEQAAAAAVFSFLQKTGMAGKMLDDCAKLGELTLGQAKAVWRKSRKAKTNRVGMFGRMLLDGERGGDGPGNRSTTGVLHPVNDFADLDDEPDPPHVLERKRRAAEAYNVLPGYTDESLAGAEAWTNDLLRQGRENFPIDILAE